jgi:hypothetical protein
MSSNAVLAAFPNRALSLARTRQPLAAIVIVLALAAAFASGGIWALASWLPDILVDRAVGANGATVQGRVAYDCSRGSRGRFLTCELAITVTGADKQTRTATQSLLIAGGPERLPPFMRIRQDPGNPARIGTEFGYEYLTARWIALLLLAGGMFALAGLCLGAIVFGNMRIKRRQAIAAVGHPAIVSAHCVRRSKVASTWDVVWHDGQQERHIRQSLDAGQEPFWIDPVEGEALALLGVKGVLLLDGNLSQLALSDAERNALWQARAPQQVAPAHAPPPVAPAARAA